MAWLGCGFKISGPPPDCAEYSPGWDQTAYSGQQREEIKRVRFYGCNSRRSLASAASETLKKRSSDLSQRKVWLGGRALGACARGARGQAAIIGRQGNEDGALAAAALELDTPFDPSRQQTSTSAAAIRGRRRGAGGVGVAAGGLAGFRGRSAHRSRFRAPTLTKLKVRFNFVLKDS